MTASTAELRWIRRYCSALVGALACYAIMGKGFAYLGVPPLFVTELLLAAGLLAWLHTRCALAPLVSVPGILLAALMALTLARTLPYVGTHGIDALRDSVLVMYGLFAFITAALLIQQPARLAGALAFLRWFTGIYVFAGPIVYMVNNVGLLEPIAGWPVAGAPLFFIRGGEMGVHLAGCAVLALVGLRPAGLAWRLALFGAVTLVASQNRGGLLAVAVPVLFALPFTRLLARAAGFAAIGIVVLGAAYAANLELPLQQKLDRSAGERALGVRQAVDNVLSLAAASDNKQLDDTKMFRLLWWKHIRDYTLEGRYFWTGKGFGVNLAIDDGFVVGERGAAPLRSPHNSHMTVLARAGVPGMALWIAFLLGWLATVMATAIGAWRRGDTEWGNLLLFAACYWLANVVNASFDVALEGPMLGVWFWVQTGFGMAVVAIYRAAASPRAAYAPPLTAPLPNATVRP